MEVQTSGYYRNQRMLDIFMVCIQYHKRMFRTPILLWFLYKRMHATRIPVVNKRKEKSRLNWVLMEFKAPLGSTGKKQDSNELNTKWVSL
jgi:hypothetical protein